MNCVVLTYVDTETDSCAVSPGDSLAATLFSSNSYQEFLVAAWRRCGCGDWSGLLFVSVGSHTRPGALLLLNI